MSMTYDKDVKDMQITEDGISSLYTENDDSDGAAEAAPTKDLAALTGRELTFAHADFPWRDIIILEGDLPAYFAEISAFKPNMPDIVLHQHDKNGPTVGQAHFRWSFSIKAGVGSDPNHMAWTDMKRGGVLNKRHYAFTLDGKSYSLRRTHSGEHGISGARKVMFSNMKITDDETGEGVALYISQPGVAKKRGSLKLKAGVSKEMEVLCMLGFAAWREKVARSGGKSSGGGGWGG